MHTTGYFAHVKLFSARLAIYNDFVMKYISTCRYTLYKQHKTGVMIINYHIKSQQTSNNTLNYLSLTHYQLSKFGFFRYGVTCQIQKSCDKTDKMAVENRHVEATGPKNSGRWPR